MFQDLIRSFFECDPVKCIENCLVELLANPIEWQLIWRDFMVDQFELAPESGFMA